MGLTATTPDDMLRQWGRGDPVHPTKEAYATMAVNILNEIDSDTILHSRVPSVGRADPGQARAARSHTGRHEPRREEWTSGSQKIAERSTSHHHSHVRGGPKRGRGFSGYRGSRGGGHPYKRRQRPQRLQGLERRRPPVQKEGRSTLLR